MRISDWSSDVCSSDLKGTPAHGGGSLPQRTSRRLARRPKLPHLRLVLALANVGQVTASRRLAWPYQVTVSSQGPLAAMETGSEERRVGQECVSTCRSRW